MPNTYNTLPYENLAIAQAHPREMKDAAENFGHGAPDINAAKILEIGCGTGQNLISIAKDLSQAKLVGIDYSQTQIDIANTEAEKQNIKNAKFICEDIANFKSAEKYDYIICHGVFSWVAPELQNKIFEICRDNLSATGLAYISYNTLPGWSFALSIRDMMLYHASQVDDVTEKVQQARSVLEFIKNGAGFANNPAKALFEKEYEHIAGNSDSYVFHEYLESDNNPVYFSTFAETAAEHRLQYICEADPKTMMLENLPPELEKILNTTNDKIKQQQYIDFMINRRFRASLLRLV